MSVIAVKVCHRNSSKVVLTYAFLDQGSSVSFCTNDLMEQLGVSGRASKLPVDTTAGACAIGCRILRGLEILDLDEQYCIPLRKAYTQDPTYQGAAYSK